MGNNSSLLINSGPVPNIPWEEKPDGHLDVLWRSKKNPSSPTTSYPPQTVSSTVRWCLSMASSPAFSGATTKPV